MNQSEAVLAAEMNVQEHRFRKGFRCDEYERRFKSVSECGLKTFDFQQSARSLRNDGSSSTTRMRCFILFPEAGRLSFDRARPPRLAGRPFKDTTIRMPSITSRTNEQWVCE